MLSEVLFWQLSGTIVGTDPQDAAVASPSSTELLSPTDNSPAPDPARSLRGGRRIQTVAGPVARTLMTPDLSSRSLQSFDEIEIGKNAFERVRIILPVGGDADP
jgi:hypothetical protein